MEVFSDLFLGKFSKKYQIKFIDVYEECVITI
jgi:hypothetical protein